MNQTGRPALSAEDLHHLGHRAYGAEWQSALSRESGTALRTIQRWASDGVRSPATAAGVRAQLEARGRVAIPVVRASRPDDRERQAYAAMAPHVDALVGAAVSAGYDAVEAVRAITQCLADINRPTRIRSYHEDGTPVAITQDQAEALAAVRPVLSPAAADQALRILRACEGPPVQMAPFDIMNTPYREVSDISSLEAVCGGLPAALIEDLGSRGALARAETLIALAIRNAGWIGTDDEILAQILAGGPHVDELLAETRAYIATAQSIRVDLDEPEGD